MSGAGCGLGARGWAARTLRGENVLLAFVAGYVDTLGFVALSGLFVAHVTGNFILIGSGLTGAGSGVLAKLLVFPAFVAGIAAARLLAGITREAPPGHHAAALYGLQCVLLGAFLLAGLAAMPMAGTEAPAAVACGLLGAAAMGVQNAHARLATRAIAANTVMTGNVTQAVLDLLELLAPTGAPDERAAVRRRLAQVMPPVLAFALGAALGALGWRMAGFAALLVPLAMLGVLAIAARHGMSGTGAGGIAGGPGR
ncbi:YoaK family protein [Burkholderia gladioli]|uniref:YoaK family protein n=1 Tax=Burkholderia gladioli TaxID=28095 RepID=UPI003B9824F9